jgi:hypothetical protein
MVLFWCAAVTGYILRYISRFGVFNSRLSRRKFPFNSATGIGSQGFDSPRSFSASTALFENNRKKFPVPAGKTGNSTVTAERRGMVVVTRNLRDFSCAAAAPSGSSAC